MVAWPFWFLFCFDSFFLRVEFLRGACNVNDVWTAVGGSFGRMWGLGSNLDLRCRKIEGVRDIVTIRLGFSLVTFLGVVRCWQWGVSFLTFPVNFLWGPLDVTGRGRRKNGKKGLRIGKRAGWRSGGRAGKRCVSCGFASCLRYLRFVPETGVEGCMC